jgi:hypothetical protein
MPRTRWARCDLLATAAFVLAFLLVLPSLLMAEEPLSEYQVKAAFMLNFTRFIEWPASAFETAESPLGICILGDDPFGAELDALVEGETVNDRKLTVRRIERNAIPRSCQVLFINKSEKDIAEILHGAGPGLLTVSDRDGFLREGGMIAFVTKDRHVRFDINQRAAVKASLIISSRMLSVARSVQK